MRKSERKLLQHLQAQTMGDLRGLIIATTYQVLRAIRHTRQDIMSKLDDLKAENQALADSINQLITEGDANFDKLQALLGQGGVSDADLQAVVDSMEATRQKVVADLARNAPSVTVPPPAGGASGGSDTGGGAGTDTGGSSGTGSDGSPPST